MKFNFIAFLEGFGGALMIAVVTWFIVSTFVSFVTLHNYFYIDGFSIRGIFVICIVFATINALLEEPIISLSPSLNLILENKTKRRKTKRWKW